MLKSSKVRYSQLFSMAVACLLTGSLAAQEAAPKKIIRVEEDWVAYIGNPDALTGAPQIANVISPVESTESAFGIVELNHGSAPDFKSGGYQVQSWIGTQNNDFAFSEESNQLLKSYDKLEYTVACALEGEQLQFILKQGRSKTWGRFATTGVAAVAPALGITLEHYNPQFSVDNTTINVGAHRVALLYQRQVRYYSADGLERTDDTARVLHRFQSQVTFVTLAEYEANPEYFNTEITE